MKFPVPNPVLRYTSPWSSSLNTGSTFSPLESPKSRYCFVVLIKVEVALVLSIVVAELSNVRISVFNASELPPLVVIVSMFVKSSSVEESWIVFTLSL